uniref:Uncharacterized protein n=1 Tax=mine drainage metagenome TaxID=410659 RepID=E6PTV3_9ZZZZ
MCVGGLGGEGDRDVKCMAQLYQLN